MTNHQPTVRPKSRERLLAVVLLTCGLLATACASETAAENTASSIDATAE